MLISNFQMFSQLNSAASTPPPSRLPPPRAQPTAKWSPLTKSEARALIQSQRYPGTAPPFVLPPERRSMPRSEINRLSRKIGHENTLQRTHHPISEVVVPAPATPDQRILHACRRKSYTAPSDQFERDTTPLW